MRSHHAIRKQHSGGDARPGPRLRASDAQWLRLGQNMGDALLRTRKHAGYGWAAALVLAGSSLIVLALLGAPEPGVNVNVSSDAHLTP